VAALHAPARDELYTAVAGEGAWRSGRRLAVSGVDAFADARLSGPRGWLKSPLLKESGARLMGHVPSLAYRFTSVASGGAEAAFASPRSNDWDLAACDLLVHEAGGRLTDLDGNPPVYNRETTRHGVLAAGNARLQPQLVALLRDVAQDRARVGLPV
jgi:myo-inositol-1(or 4)-monophosphatase